MSNDKVSPVEMVDMPTVKREEIIAGGLTQTEINNLKSKYGELTLISTKNENGDPVHLWFKKPNMQTMSASAKLMQRDPMEAVLIYGKNCLIKGDPSVFEDVDIVSTITEPLMELVQTRSLEVKKF